MSFNNYIKAVGTGPKGNRDLTFEESKDMMLQILSRDIDDILIGAFLIAWRLKPETIEEFQGAIAACDQFTKRKKVLNSIELGYAFDGKTKHPYLLNSISRYTLGKIELVVATDVVQPSKDGVTLNQLFNSKRIPDNLHIFQRKIYSPALHELTTLRNRLSLRTAINTFEKLPNIASSDYAVTGVFHQPYVHKYMKMFASRYKRFAVIQGNEGSPEVFKKSKLWICNSGDLENLEEFTINLDDFGINALTNKTPLEKSDLIEQSFQIEENLDKLAKLNAAILLFIGEKVTSIQEGFKSLE